MTGIIAIGKQLAHKLLETESALLEDARFSILEENNIVGCQC
jgi:hypothetical protein